MPRTSSSLLWCAALGVPAPLPPPKPPPPPPPLDGCCLVAGGSLIRGLLVLKSSERLSRPPACTTSQHPGLSESARQAGRQQVGCCEEASRPVCP